MTSWLVKKAASLFSIPSAQNGALEQTNDKQIDDEIETLNKQELYFFLKLSEIGFEVQNKVIPVMPKVNIKNEIVRSAITEIILENGLCSNNYFNDACAIICDSSVSSNSEIGKLLSYLICPTFKEEFLSRYNRCIQVGNFYFIDLSTTRFCVNFLVFRHMARRNDLIKKLLFTARFKNSDSVFYKDNMPLDIFKLLFKLCYRVDIWRFWREEIQEIEKSIHVPNSFYYSTVLNSLLCISLHYYTQ